MLVESFACAAMSFIASSTALRAMHADRPQKKWLLKFTLVVKGKEESDGHHLPS